jgi:uncharacterized membrane protein YqjE
MSDERFPIQEPDKTLGQLVGDLTSEFSTLVSAHLDLAKAELRQDAKEAGRASAMLAAGAVGALLAIAMLSAALGWALAETMAPGWAFLIVGLLWAVVAGALVLAGKQRVTQLDSALADTMHEIKHEIKEDQRWLKTQNS